MKNSKSKIFGMVFSLVIAFSSLNARAEEEPQPTTTKEEDGQLLFGSSPVSDLRLDESRGTSGFNAEVLGVSILEASSSNNSLSGNITTGHNFISDNAFGNSQGVVSLIQNSGNNVIIQSSTIVNLTLQ